MQMRLQIFKIFMLKIKLTKESEKETIDTKLT